MQLDIGNNIRNLRRCHRKTQEALAVALGVTAQAVSRWESGGSYPDMNLIPSIANFFGVTIDELFGYTNQRTHRIDELVLQIEDMKRSNNGTDRNISECIALAKEALIEFPGNDKLMAALASGLYAAGYVRHGEHHLIDREGYSVYDTQTHQTYAEWREAIHLYERAIETLPQGPQRDQAMEELSQLYVNTGRSDKAMALAASAPTLWNSREFLQTYACDGKEKARAIGSTLLHVARSCAMLMVHCTMVYQNDMTPGQKAQSIRGAITVFHQICPDGNFGAHSGFVSHLHLFLSLYLWLDDRKAEAFEALEDARLLYDAYTRLCADKQFQYTAPLVQLVQVDFSGCDLPDPSDPANTAASLPHDWPWWNVPEAELVKAQMQADPRWNEWAARTQT